MNFLQRYRNSSMIGACMILYRNNKVYLLLCILPFCLGWELPQNYFLQLRVLCLDARLCTVYLNKSISKSCLIIQLCHETACFYLQVLLVLCLISPLNDSQVVWAAMVLKFEKEVKTMNTVKAQAVHY